MPGYGKSYGGMGRTTTKKRAKQTAKRAANPAKSMNRPRRGYSPATSTSSSSNKPKIGNRGKGISARNPPTLRKPTKTKSNPRKPVRR